MDYKEVLEAIAKFPDMAAMHELLEKQGQLTEHTKLLPPYIVMARLADLAVKTGA
jgi:hypothetical protein